MAPAKSRKRLRNAHWPRLSLPASKPLVVNAWSTPQDPADLKERFAEYAQAGFTHALSAFRNLKHGRLILDQAQRHGIAVFPMGHHSKIPLAKIAREFRNHPALAGYFLQDEPENKDFPALNQTARQLMQIDSDPSRIFYANLFPNYATNEQLGLKPHQQYSEHVYKFLCDVPVNVLSFDFYPTVRFSINLKWYGNLDLIREAAAKAKIPFWSFLASVGSELTVDPTLGTLRLQVYTALAYGSVGIQHFIYMGLKGYTFRAAAIDVDGERTATYDLVRQVNREIQAQAGVFVGSTVKQVRYVGKTLPPGTKAYKPAKPITKLEAGPNGAVAAELAKDRLRFLVVVNQDFMTSMPLELAWDPSVHMGLVDKDGSVKPVRRSALKTELDPGDAAILMWQTEE